jgi:hypothetical protein
MNDGTPIRPAMTVELGASGEEFQNLHEFGRVVNLLQPHRVCGYGGTGLGERVMPVIVGCLISAIHRKVDRTHRGSIEWFEAIPSHSPPPAGRKGTPDHS